jgi:hypothetical protein
VRPSLDCLPGDEWLLDDSEVAVRSVDEVTLLPPAVVHQTYLLRSFLRLGSIATRSSLLSLASGSWTPTKLELSSLPETRTSAQVTIGSHLRGGLLYRDPLIRTTVAQHAGPLPKSVLYVHRIAPRFVVQSSKGSERVCYPSSLYGETYYILLSDHFSNTFYGAPVRRLSGLHGETCYVLLCDNFSNALYGAALHSRTPPIEWHLQLSQLKRIPHPVPHVRGEATPDEQFLGSLTRRKLKQLSIRDLWLASE